MVIDSKTRSKLNSLAMKLEPVVTIGKNGLTDTVFAEIEVLLEARELIKIQVLKNSDADIKETLEQICKSTKAEPIACVGSKMVIYRFSKKKDIVHIKLS